MAKSNGAPVARTAPLALDVWTVDPPAVSAGLVEWLTAPESLVGRLRAVAADDVRLRVVHQGLTTLAADYRALLGVDTENCFEREIELLVGATPWVYAKTLVPDTTLNTWPWLAELGDSPIGEVLGAFPGVDRGPFTYAELAAVHPLCARAQRARAPADRETLTARRSVFSVRGHALLVQEVLLAPLAAHAHR